MRVIADRIVVKREEAADTTPGGIVLPEGAKDKPSRGSVVAVGPGTKDAPMSIFVGDRVVFPSFSGVEVEEGGVTYTVLREIDVLFVV